MASIDNLKASDGSGNASVATVQNVRAPLATTIQVDTVQGINDHFFGTMGTPHTFTDPISGETITIISEATAVDFRGHVDGTDLEIDEIAPGYVDGGSEVGDIVIIRPTTQWADEVAEVLEVVHEDDGNLKSGKANRAIQLPQGGMLNGKIVRTVATNDLTVAIKTLAGADPSASDPVYVRIGDTIRTITAALTVTKLDGTNWHNAGSALLATFEVDYFVYIGWNAANSVPVLAFARWGTARVYSDFSTTTTADNYGTMSTVTGAAATDEFQNVGRFNAILSAGAGYTWSVPATSVIVNHPIFFTRMLTCAAKIRAGTTDPTIGTDGPALSSGIYQIYADRCAYAFINAFGTSGMGNGSGTYYVQLPFKCDTASTAISSSSPINGLIRNTDSSAGVTAYGNIEYDTTVVQSLAAGSCMQMVYPTTGAASGNPLGIGTVTHTTPWTWAASDSINGDVNYKIGV